MRGSTRHAVTHEARNVKKAAFHLSKRNRNVPILNEIEMSPVLPDALWLRETPRHQCSRSASPGHPELCSIGRREGRILLTARKRFPGSPYLRRRDLWVRNELIEGNSSKAAPRWPVV